MSDAVLLLALVVLALLVGLILAYNKLAALRIRATNAWSDIDVQLKRRWELIPNLVEAVRGYAAHEQRTLEETIAARSRAQQATAIPERGAAESEVTRATHQLLALTEAYPQLKANELFARLYHDLVEVESHLASSRKYYNAVVRDFNTAIQQFPSNIVARLAGHEELAFFQLEDETEAAAPRITLEAPRP
ncbi:MAG TPA: LemA family protein [bacterium]|nr:LemA family protein [bacterium]